jgi:hypothetical protein
MDHDEHKHPHLLLKPSASPPPIHPRHSPEPNVGNLLRREIMIARLYLPIATCTRRTSTAPFVWSGITACSRRPSIPKCCELANTISLAQQQQQHHQQVRFHRTNYEGPGKFDERETGTKAFEEAARAHDNNEHHDHSHQHHHDLDNSNADDNCTNNSVVEAESKEQKQQLLHARYIRRSGSYARRGYTIGIGGPGECRRSFFGNISFDPEYVLCISFCPLTFVAYSLIQLALGKLH